MDERLINIKKRLEKKVILSPVVKLEKIRNFESKYKVKLPKELVLFYTQISNGCKMIDDFKLYAFEEWKFDSVLINKDFLFSKYWIWEDEKENVDYESIKNGTIELIDIGDAQTWNVVVTGKNQGDMWFYTDVGIQPCAPSKKFLDWFELWLDGKENFFEEF